MKKIALQLKPNLRKKIGKPAYKAFMAMIPHSLKYAMVCKWIRRYPPYNLLRKGDVVIHVGAKGQLCKVGRSMPVIYSRIVGDEGQVWVFESVTMNFALLRDYIETHKLKNISIWNFGINNFTNLDRLFSNSKRVNLISLTTDGTEPDLVEGAINIIKKYHPIIYMPFPCEEERFFLFLEKLGYTIHADRVRLYFIGKRFGILWAKHK